MNPLQGAVRICVQVVFACTYAKVIMLIGDSDIRQNDGCECDSCIRHCGPDPQSLSGKRGFLDTFYTDPRHSGGLCRPKALPVKIDLLYMDDVTEQ
jgi:hypothetical protein